MQFSAADDVDELNSSHYFGSSVVNTLLLITLTIDVKNGQIKILKNVKNVKT